MSDQGVKGGAGPALAAHSKDGAATGQTPASEATATAPHPTRFADAAKSTLTQAQDLAGRASSSVSDAMHQARERFSAPGGEATTQAAEWVRAQPFVALAAAGTAGLILGMLLARR